MIPLTFLRILALDLRPRALGYAVFEGPGRLLDYGASRYHGASSMPAIALGQRLGALVEQWQPAVVVLKNRKLVIGQDRLRRVIARVKREVVLRGLTLRVLDSRSVARSFRAEGRITKHEVAALIAERLPELAWKLPPKRRCWEPEDYRMSIFDACAVGLAYFAAAATNETSTPQETAA